MGAIVNYLFAVLGHAIGSRPVTFILISIAIFAISLLGPIFRLDIRMDLKSGFTRKDAPSAQEVGAHIKFFGNLGDPWYLALFAEVKNKSGSLLEPAESGELTNFYDYVVKMNIEDGNTTFQYNPSGNVPKICTPFCDFNAGLWNLYAYKDWYKLYWPLASIGIFKSNIGKFFFDRTLYPNGTMRSSKTVAVYFTTFVNDAVKDRKLKLFERDVLREVKKHNANSTMLLRLVLHGAYAVSKEIQRGVRMAAPYYLVGAILLILFVVFSFIFASKIYKQMYCGKAYLMAVAVLSPVLASITAIGFVLLFGFHINMLVLISPFLTLAIGIGVDDAFLISNTWMMQRDSSLSEGHIPAERLQLVLEKVGAAMAVTSLTNVIGFALGCLAPVPEIRLFCAAVALSMFFDLVFQLTLYAPLVVLIANHEPSERTKYEAVKTDNNEKYNAEKLENGDQQKVDISSSDESFPQTVRMCFHGLSMKYSQFVASLWAEMLAVAIVITYLLLSIRGIHSLKTNMDGKMLIPPDSQSNDGIQIISEVVWPDYLGINYMIRKPPDFSDPVQYRRFMRMVDAIERTKYAIGRNASMMWIYDYRRFLIDDSGKMWGAFLDPIVVDEAEYEKTGLDMSRFEEFLETEPYDAWKGGVKYDTSSGKLVITEMLLMIGYEGTHSLGDKARLMPICRHAARLYPEYDIIPFDTDSQMIDVILDAPYTTRNTMFYTVLAIGAVFFILSWNFTTAIVATLSVASICVGVLGMLHYWGCHLDPLTMVAVIMTAGLGVDFTVHITFHYLMNEKDHDDNARRINAAFHGCGLSMIQAGTSTFLVMLPVLFCPIGIYTVIAKAIVLVVLIGLVHGLFIVPVLLTTIPNCLTGQKCCADAKSPD